MHTQIKFAAGGLAGPARAGKRSSRRVHTARSNHGPRTIFQGVTAALAAVLALTLAAFPASASMDSLDVYQTSISLGVWEGGTGIPSYETPPALSFSATNQSQISGVGTTPGGWQVSLTGRIDGLTPGGSLFTAKLPIRFILTDLTVSCATPGIGCDSRVAIRYFLQLRYAESPFDRLNPSFGLEGSIAPLANAGEAAGLVYGLNLYTLIVEPPPGLPPTFPFEYDEAYADGSTPLTTSTFNLDVPAANVGSIGETDQMYVWQGEGGLESSGFLIVTMGPDQTFTLPGSFRATLDPYRAFPFEPFANQAPAFHIANITQDQGKIKIDLVLANWERRYQAPAKRILLSHFPVAPDCWFRGNNPNSGLLTSLLPPGAPRFASASPGAINNFFSPFGVCYGMPSNEAGMVIRDLYPLWPTPSGPVAASLETRCEGVPGCDPDTLLVDTGELVDFLRTGGFNTKTVSVWVSDWDEGEVLNLKAQMMSDPAPLPPYPWQASHRGVHLVRLPPGTTGWPSPGVVVGNPAVGPWPEGTLFLNNPAWEIPGVATIGVVTDGGGPYRTPRTTAVPLADASLDRNEDVILDNLTYPSPGQTKDGLFRMKALFRNSLADAIGDLCFRVRELSGGALRLENANMPGPGGVGAALCVGRLEPGQSKQIELVIKLTSPPRPFTFFVDAFDNSVGPEALFDTQLSLTPVNAQQLVRTVVRDAGGFAVAGANVTFRVTSPTLPPLQFQATTDAQGVASIQYTRTQPGVDTIRAVLEDSSGVARTTGKQFVEWQ